MKNHPRIFFYSPRPSTYFGRHYPVPKPLSDIILVCQDRGFPVMVNTVDECRLDMIRDMNGFVFCDRTFFPISCPEELEGVRFETSAPIEMVIDYAIKLDPADLQLIRPYWIALMADAIWETHSIVWSKECLPARLRTCVKPEGIILESLPQKENGKEKHGNSDEGGEGYDHAKVIHHSGNPRHFRREYGKVVPEEQQYDRGT